VQTSNYDAEFGRSASSTINVVTRSGGNQYHGGGFEFVQNNDFNAGNAGTKLRFYVTGFRVTGHISGGQQMRYSLPVIVSERSLCAGYWVTAQFGCTAPFRRKQAVRPKSKLGVPSGQVVSP
jgi:hypothetical protein